MEASFRNPEITRTLKFEDLFVSTDVFRYIDFFLKISLMNMKIFIFMFEVLISNNKEKINIAPSPPWDAPGKKYFIEFLVMIRRN